MPTIFSYSSLMQNSIIRTGFIMSALCILIQWIIIAMFMWQLPPEIPLYFSLPAGQNQLASKNMFILIPIMSICITLLNSAMIRLNKNTPIIYPQIISWSNALITFLGAISMIHVTMLVM